MVTPGQDRVLVIAEAGVNHNGSIERALAMVDTAAEAGADTVKFQTFRAGRLASRQAPLAAYQENAIGAGESQLEMLRRLELDEAAHRRLMERCAERGIEFLSTPFDPESLTLLAERLDLPRLKLGSGELTNAPLLLAAGRSKKPVILSTGMGRLEEVEAALGVLALGYLGGERASLDAFADAFADPRGKAMLRDKVILLHCTTEYPAPHSEANLRAMDTLARSFGLPVGFSDHTLGSAVALAAVALGAAVIEKHFTLDRSLPGPDHQASIEAGELAELVTGIRQIEAALGDGVKAPTRSERRNIAVVRKSLVAACPIARGELFTPENLTVKRPGGGVSPFRYWELLGNAAARDYAEDDLIEP